MTISTTLSAVLCAAVIITGVAGCSVQVTYGSPAAEQDAEEQANGVLRELSAIADNAESAALLRQQLQRPQALVRADNIETWTPEQFKTESIYPAAIYQTRTQGKTVIASVYVAGKASPTALSNEVIKHACFTTTLTPGSYKTSTASVTCPTLPNQSDFGEEFTITPTPVPKPHQAPDPQNPPGG